MVKNINDNSVDGSGPLTYDSVSLCEWLPEWLPEFQKDILSSSSRFQDTKRSDAFHCAILLSLLMFILRGLEL